MTLFRETELPVVVIGAGPQGLAAAAHLLERGVEPVVLEAASGPGAAIAQWSHVRTFSPWPELIDTVSARLLGASGWVAPQSGFPIGGEWLVRYLEPLAQALGERVWYRARVVGVSRQGHDRVLSAGRDVAPFVVHVVDDHGQECRLLARAVIDASGTWANPNPAGADGLPTLGERSAADAGILTYVPPRREDFSAWAGQHVVVIGSGHSAMTAVIELAELVRSGPDTRVTWVLRRGAVGDAFGRGDADALPQRGALGARARSAVEAGFVTLQTGFRTERFTPDGDNCVVVSAEDGRRLAAADRVVVLTGFRPDLSFLSELRLELDPVLQAPVRLAPEIDPNLHNCGTVPPHGAAELRHSGEPGFFMVGMKSYGRAPTFLALTGYEQVRSVVAELVGDHEGARKVELVLPETGACAVGLADPHAHGDGVGELDMTAASLNPIGV